MKTLLVVCLVLIVVTHGEAVKKANANCSQQRLQGCSDAFAKTLGLPGMPTDLSKLVQTMTDLESKDLDGAKQVCKATTGLTSCLDDQYSSCISLDYLHDTMHESPQDALTIVSTLTGYNYMCTTGWNVINQNYDCLMKTQKDNVQYFQQCSKKFNEDAQKDPANVCKYTQQLADCQDDIYKKNCNQALSQTMCETQKAIYAATGSKCTISCTGGGGGGASTVTLNVSLLSFALIYIFKNAMSCF